MEPLSQISPDQVAAFKTRSTPEVSPATGRMTRVRGYWQMTRPSVVALVFFTAVPMLFLVPGGLPPLAISIGLLAGSAARPLRWLQKHL